MQVSPQALAAIGVGALLAASAGIGSGTAAAREAVTRQAVARPPAFAACAACHSIEPGKNGVGPSLAGVAGRKAASLPGYAYSNALKNAEITWDAASLDRWLTSPQRAVPGTKMPFPGIADAARRREVVNYLLSLK